MKHQHRTDHHPDRAEFRLVRAFDAQHNLRRLEKFCERLKHAPEVRRSSMRIRLLTRRRLPQSANLASKAPAAPSEHDRQTSLR